MISDRGKDAIQWVSNRYFLLHHWPANFVYKGLDSIVGLAGHAVSVSTTEWTLRPKRGGNHRQYVNENNALCSHKTLFTKQEATWTWSGAEVHSPCVSDALCVTKLVSEGAQIPPQLCDSKLHALSSTHLQIEMDLTVLIFCLPHEDADQQIVFEHDTLKRYRIRKGTQPQNKAYHMSTFRTVTPHHKTRVLVISILLILFLVQSCKCLKFTSNMWMVCAIGIFRDFQCLFVQLLCVAKLLPLHVHTCQLVKRLSYSWVIWIQSRFSNF